MLFIRWWNVTQKFHKVLGRKSDLNKFCIRFSSSRNVVSIFDSVPFRNCIAPFIMVEQKRSTDFLYRCNFKKTTLLVMEPWNCIKSQKEFVFFSKKKTQGWLVESSPEGFWGGLDQNLASANLPRVSGASHRDTYNFSGSFIRIYVEMIRKSYLRV